MYRTGNILIGKLSRETDASVESKATYKGVAFKSIYFGILTILSAVASIILIQKVPDIINGLLIGALIGASVFGIIAAFAPNTIPVTGSIYCALIGLCMGAASWAVEQVWPGVVTLALLSTVITFVTISVLFGLGLIKPTKRAMAVVFSALISIMLIGIIAFVVSLRVPSLWNLFFGNSLLSIGISIIMVFIASFFVLCDIAQIQTIVSMGLNKKLEWRAAYGLVIGIIWLYLEFLRLFSKIQSRSR